MLLFNSRFDCLYDNKKYELEDRNVFMLNTRICSQTTSKMVAKI